MISGFLPGSASRMALLHAFGQRGRQIETGGLSFSQGRSPPASAAPRQRTCRGSVGDLFFRDVVDAARGGLGFRSPAETTAEKKRMKTWIYSTLTGRVPDNRLAQAPVDGLGVEPIRVCCSATSRMMAKRQAGMRRHQPIDKIAGSPAVPAGAGERRGVQSERPGPARAAAVRSAISRGKQGDFPRSMAKPMSFRRPFRDEEWSSRPEAKQVWMTSAP